MSSKIARASLFPPFCMPVKCIHYNIMLLVRSHWVETTSKIQQLSGACMLQKILYVARIHYSKLFPLFEYMPFLSPYNQCARTVRLQRPSTFEPCTGFLRDVHHPNKLTTVGSLVKSRRRNCHKLRTSDTIMLFRRSDQSRCRSHCTASDSGVKKSLLVVLMILPPRVHYFVFSMPCAGLEVSKYAGS